VKFLIDANIANIQILTRAQCAPQNLNKIERHTVSVTSWNTAVESEQRAPIKRQQKQVKNQPSKDYVQATMTVEERKASNIGVRVVDREFLQLGFWPGPGLGPSPPSGPGYQHNLIANKRISLLLQCGVSGNPVHWSGPCGMVDRETGTSAKIEPGLQP